MALVSVSSGALGSTEPEPWELLAQVRGELSRKPPLEARFTQTFVPSGFSAGDSESGTLYVDLPLCLRFEYREPFPKNFLLCGDWIYTWNPGEPSGRRFLIADDDRGGAGGSENDGLDLLRLEVDSLRERYRAETVLAVGAHSVIELTPVDPTGTIRSASIEIGPRSESAISEGLGLRALSYEDLNGDRTRFEITSYTRLEGRTALEPPKIEWLED